MTVQIDASELLALADELRAAGEGLIGKIRPTVSKGSLNVKTQMRREMAASVHFKGAAHTIGYEIREGVGWIESEIGPTTGAGKGTGAISNIAYFGGANGGGGTVPDPMGALEKEIPNLEKFINEIVDGLL